MSKLSYVHDGRLNRNILECKCAIGVKVFLDLISLNRNILECKFQSAFQAVLFSQSLNRNILECKSRAKNFA